MKGTTPALVVSTLVVLAPWGTAFAQPVRGYVSAGIGSYTIGADEVAGSAAALGVAVGAPLARWLDVELDIVRPAAPFHREYTGTSVSFAGPGASREEIERLAVVSRFAYERRVTASISGVVIFHVPDRRWHPGVLVGVTAVPVRERRRIETLTVPPGVAPSHPSLRMRDERASRVRGGITVGGRLAIELAPHVTLTPDVRIDFGSIGDEIDNVLRSSVRVAWRF